MVKHLIQRQDALIIKDNNCFTDRFLVFATRM